MKTLALLSAYNRRIFYLLFWRHQVFLLLLFLQLHSRASAQVKQWDKTIGGQAEENLTAMVATPEGGYILGGTSLSGTGGDKSQGSRGKEDYWVVKTDAAGKKIWDKRFGGNEDDNLAAIVATPDGGYILA